MEWKEQIEQHIAELAEEVDACMRYATEARDKELLGVIDKHGFRPLVKFAEAYLLTEGTDNKLK
jgi:glutamine phosphoribosylpyrophosphate amidotransferase